MKPHIVRVFDPVCRRPVWQAWIRHSDGTREWVASSGVSLYELADRIADWHMAKIIEAQQEIRRLNEH